MEKEKFVLFFYNDFESMGIQYLSSVLKENGIKTDMIYQDILDSYAGDTFESLKTEIIPQIAQKIVDKNPDVLGFSTITNTLQIHLAIAAKVKELNSNIIILTGGIHPMLLPEKTLDYPQFDAICLGDGEYAVLEYMKKLDDIRNGSKPVIEGIVYKQNGEIIGSFDKYTMIEDLDNLPFPDKELFYSKNPSFKEIYWIKATRGCLFACSYCINDFMKRKVTAKYFRKRSPENIIKELIYIRDKYSPKCIAFLDEVFGEDKQWTVEFLSMYKKQINLPFISTIHPSYVTEEIVDLLKEAKCNFLQMGVQSLTERPEISKLLKRKIDRNDVANAIRIIRSRKISLQCDHIFGIPGENYEDLVDALAFYNENRPSYVSVFYLAYFPKASITEYVYKNKLITEERMKDIEEGNIPDLKQIQEYPELNFCYNYFIFFPKWFVRFIINSGMYKSFKINNFYFSTALPRFINAVLEQNFNIFYLKNIIKKKFLNLVGLGINPDL